MAKREETARELIRKLQEQKQIEAQNLMLLSLQVNGAQELDYSWNRDDSLDDKYPPPEDQGKLD